MISVAHLYCEWKKSELNQIFEVRKTWRGENMKIFQKYQEVGIFIGTTVMASLTSQNEK